MVYTTLALRLGQLRLGQWTQHHQTHINIHTDYQHSLNEWYSNSSETPLNY